MAVPLDSLEQALTGVAENLDSSYTPCPVVETVDDFVFVVIVVFVASFVFVVVVVVVIVIVVVRPLSIY